MEYQEAGRNPPFPIITAGQYLLDALYEAGPVKSDPLAGSVALDWTDLHAYVALTGAISEPWEARALRDMSQAYERGMREGSNPFSIMPMERVRE